MLKFFRNFIRWFIAIVLIIYLLTKVDLKQMGIIILSFQWFWLVFIVIILSLIIYFSVNRWQRLLAVHGVNIGLLSLTKLLLIGYMYSDILPSSVSGDLARAYYLSHGHKTENNVAIATIIIEKISSLFAIVFYLLLGIVFNFKVFLIDKGHIYFLFLAAILIMFILILIFFNKRVKNLAHKYFKDNNSRFIIFLKKYYQAVHFYRGYKGLLVYSLSISIIIQGLTILMNYFIILGLGIDLGILEVIFVISLVLIANLVPATAGNLGWREGIYVYSLGFYGIGSSMALALALFVRLLRLILSLSGMGFAFGYKNLFKFRKV